VSTGEIELEVADLDHLWQRKCEQVGQQIPMPPLLVPRMQYESIVERLQNGGTVTLKNSGLRFRFVDGELVLVWRIEAR
jgi:hypothetical protein